MNRLIRPVTAALFLLALIPAEPTFAKDNWISVRSTNFFLVGNASEKEVREVATRLEQFRDVFSRLLPGMHFTSPVPTTVIVFKSDSSYKPFKPLINGKPDKVAGFFQSGSDVNYITLTTEKLPENPYGVIFHEYVHLLVNNTLGKAAVPTWFNEGLAEYYSALNIEEDQKVYLGSLLPRHLQLLRSNKLIPLEQLFAVDYYSLPRNSHNAMGIFYAQSWLLVHYLIQGNEGKKLPQLTRFVNLLSSNTSLENAFRDAFQTDYASLEKELKNYLQQHTFRRQVATFERKLEFESEMKSSAMSEAEAQAYLGDLLRHINRPEDAKVKLEEALAIDNKLAMAHASLGMTLLEQKKFAEAKEHLARAVSENSTNYLAHYYYAYVVSREVIQEGQPVSGFPQEVIQTMRSHLSRAIELKPDFPESYHLLAFVNLVSGEQLDESIKLIRRALALSPGNENFSFVLAQLYLRKQDLIQARKVVEPLAAKASDPQMRANAESLLKVIIVNEEQADRRRAFNENPARNADSMGPSKASETSPPPPTVETTDPAWYLREALRQPEAGETHTQGTLLRIECDARGVTFVINVGDKTLRLKNRDFDSISITTYTPDVAGEIDCSTKKAETNVVIAYVPSADAKAKIDGELRAVEFVPKDFKLKP
jgi:tetratricopeptide (TPR) repeat protein